MPQHPTLAEQMDEHERTREIAVAIDATKKFAIEDAADVAFNSVLRETGSYNAASRVREDVLDLLKPKRKRRQ